MPCIFCHNQLSVFQISLNYFIFYRCTPNNRTITKIEVLLYLTQRLLTFPNILYALTNYSKVLLRIRKCYIKHVSLVLFCYCTWTNLLKLSMLSSFVWFLGSLIGFCWQSTPTSPQGSISSRGKNIHIDEIHGMRNCLPYRPGAPVAQWVKRWPTDLAIPSSSPARGEIISTVNEVPLQAAFHYQTLIALIWPIYCWKRT